MGSYEDIVEHTINVLREKVIVENIPHPADYLDSEESYDHGFDCGFAEGCAYALRLLVGNNDAG